jgi:hypothetical protein
MLTPEQFGALQVADTFISATVKNLETSKSMVFPEGMAVKALRDLGLYALDRLNESFPELAQRQGGRVG